MTADKPALRARVHKTILECLQGDITKQKTDAIVNAANAELTTGTTTT